MPTTITQRERNDSSWMGYATEFVAQWRPDGPAQMAVIYDRGHERSYDHSHDRDIRVKLPNTAVEAVVGNAEDARQLAAALLQAAALADQEQAAAAAAG